MKPILLYSFFQRLSRALVMGCALLACPAIGEEITIAGTGNALGSMRLLAEAFSKQAPAIKVTVLDSLGSSGALKAVPAGAIDIGLSSRAPSDAERRKGILAIEYARSLTVLAVSTRSGATAITREQIAEIYGGRLTKWPDGTPIRPIMRQSGDDNTKQLKRLSPAIEAALVVAEQRPGLTLAVTDQEAADRIESIPGAIGVSTLALIQSEGRALRALKLDQVAATTGNGAAGDYPMIKRFFFLTRLTPSAGVRQFTAFVRSPAGGKILKQSGCWLP
ncbi:MAG: substrate-binding domain-containing protein [Candidatus Accumulibacter sp. UW20]|jgi:phosphate transport system substrate-binding protein